MIDEKNEALKISAKLEYLIKTKKVKAQDISNYIGLTKQVVSLNRQKLKSGRLPTAKFLLGITLFFKENFFDH